MSMAVGGNSGWRRLLLVLALAVVAGPAGQVRAAAPRVLPDGAVPEDRRLEELKDFNGYFPSSLRRRPRPGPSVPRRSNGRSSWRPDFGPCPSPPPPTRSFMG